MTLFGCQIEAVYLFAVGDLWDENFTDLFGTQLDHVCPVHTVSFNAKEEKTILTLKHLSFLTAGRWAILPIAVMQRCDDIWRMSTEWIPQWRLFIEHASSIQTGYSGFMHLLKFLYLWMNYATHHQAKAVARCQSFSLNSQEECQQVTMTNTTLLEGTVTLM